MPRVNSGFESFSGFETTAAATATFATGGAEMFSKPLNDSKPEFTRGISVQHAKDNKTFGT
jgi:hypothetical protein